MNKLETTKGANMNFSLHFLIQFFENLIDLFRQIDSSLVESYATLVSFLAPCIRKLIVLNN